MLRELRRISKILILTNASTIEKELSKIASSDDRKCMWICIDGKRMPKNIANEVGVTQIAVSYFLNAGVAAGLIEYVKGEPPRRILDYVPPVWIDLVELPPPEGIKEKEVAPQESDEIKGGSHDRKN